MLRNRPINLLEASKLRVKKEDFITQGIKQLTIYLTIPIWAMASPWCKTGLLFKPTT
jgi:hypothetical protein